MYWPEAKLGGGNYVYVFSQNGVNYYGVSAVQSFAVGDIPPFTTGPGMTVKQAYMIDSKVDDGLPMSGTVGAVYLSIGPGWGGLYVNGSPGYPSLTAGTASTCIDDGNILTPPYPWRYSIEVNGGSGLNCGLSFQLQGGD
jgi:hypothetical protein